MMKILVLGLCITFFITILQTEAGSNKNICKLKAETGPCTGSFLRYFFNHKTGECEEFSYGGCGGNENNFETFDECEETCLESEDICRLKPETGPCKAAIERYFFNHKTGKCETFTYGGCKGNANNFETIEDCEMKCSHNKKDICRLKPETGPCRAAIKRYYFNHKTGKCETFTYGGCKGNANNFKTVEDCKKRCSLKKKCKYCPDRKDIICIDCQDQCYSNDDCPDSCVCCKENCGNECRFASPFPTHGEPADGPSCRTCGGYSD